MAEKVESIEDFYNRIGKEETIFFKRLKLFFKSTAIYYKHKEIWFPLNPGDISGTFNLDMLLEDNNE